MGMKAKPFDLLQIGRGITAMIGGWCFHGGASDRGHGGSGRRCRLCERNAHMRYDFRRARGLMADGAVKQGMKSGDVDPCGKREYCIGAETPEEIAVSITAQLIMVRAGRKAGGHAVDAAGK